MLQPGRRLSEPTGVPKVSSSRKIARSLFRPPGLTRPERGSGPPINRRVASRTRVALNRPRMQLIQDYHRWRATAGRSSERSSCIPPAAMKAGGTIVRPAQTRKAAVTRGLTGVARDHPEEPCFSRTRNSCGAGRRITALTARFHPCSRVGHPLNVAGMICGRGAAGLPRDAMTSSIGVTTATSWSVGYRADTGTLAWFQHRPLGRVAPLTLRYTEPKRWPLPLRV